MKYEADPQKQPVSQEPSLSEMTLKAIDMLSTKPEDGFS